MEIHGFKSFYDRTEVVFDRRVTGVVGPNGCGKSNILDAISWVLGEQSVKSLRGSRMLDVIFNGSERFKPVGMADVTLTLSSPDTLSRGESKQTSLTRRLHRSGESEYLLNGVPCRLRDIQDVLHGTGMGVRAYSFIEQGKIGGILSSKPHERRLLIEEAAGITKFRARRREAELKLEAAQGNLVRVHDIIRELEGRMTSLKRQASRARRYQRLRRELEQVLARLYGLEYRGLTAAEQEVLERHSRESDRKLALSAEVSSLEADLENRRLQLDKAESGLAGSHTSLHELVGETDRTRQSISFGRERLEETRQRAGELEQESRQAAQELEQADAECARAAQVLASGRAASDEVAAVVNELERLRMKGGLQLARIDAEIEDLRAEQLRLVGRAAELGNALQGRQRLVTQHQSRRERLQAELDRIEVQHRDALQREAAVALSLAEAERRLEQQGAAVGRQQDATSGARRLEIEARQAYEEASRRAAKLGERLHALDELLERGRDLGAASEAVMSSLAHQQGFTASGVLADHLRVDEEYERAVEAVLHRRLGAILIDGAPQALQALEALADEEAAGEVSFLLGGAPARPAEQVRSEPPNGVGVVGRLRDLMRPAGRVVDPLRALVGETVVVSELGHALDLVAQDPGLTVVTLAGELLEPGGWLRAGRSAGDGVLALRRERRELDAHAAGAGVHEQETRRNLELAAAGLEQAEQELASARLAHHDAEKEVLALGRDLEAADERCVRLGRSLEALVLESETLDEDLSRLLEEQREDEQMLAAVDGRRTRLEDGLSAARCRREEHQQEESRRLRELSEAEEVSVRAQEALAALGAEQAKLALRSRQCRESVNRLEQEARQNHERQQRVMHENEALEQRLEGLITATAELEQRIRDEEAEVSGLRHALTEQEVRLKERRRETEQQSERLQAVVIERTRLEGELGRLAERCREDLHCEPGEALALAESDQRAEAESNVDQEQDDEFDLDQSEETEPVDRSRDLSPEAEAADELENLRRRAAGLRTKLDRIGPVNVLAIEEFEELSERHGFLHAQSSDLTESIDSLNQTIARINRTSRDRFRSAFEAVNAHFSELFQVLFEGGRAELRLTEEEDVLEAGIEIVAQPPGKRLQNILLLSGGEKALTAIALLFALFRYKPSPFCILDEVDAPLDEPNIRRFLGLLQELNRDTQFILITHSPTTMKAADVLYGVTMSEPGVSQLVSVDLKDRSSAA
jgi:chromosome segregation protein